MKRLIESIQYSDLDNSPGVWRDVPMVPATGEFSSESKPTASGQLKTVKLSFLASGIFPSIFRNLSLLVKFDDGGMEMVGTDSLPAKLQVNKKSTISCSCKWETPEF